MITRAHVRSFLFARPDTKRRKKTGRIFYTRMKQRKKEKRRECKRNKTKIIICIETKRKSDSIRVFFVILYAREEDKEMGLTNSRRLRRVEETSAVHPSYVDNIDQKKTNEDEKEEEEKINEVCF